jgi:UDP-N-acetylglucosamine 2-epimerase (non-hydrolysing)
VLVVGTRPEAIKLAPVAHALDRRGLPPLLMLTGQHPQLHPADYGLGSFVAARLGCAGREDPHAHVGDVSRAAVPVLRTLSPKIVLVQGDTSSALGGALAARIAGIAVGHVEAGLRSHDRRNPWPEEEFRIAIDADCELLFAPTELSAANLRRERVRGQIHVTGNSGIDSLPAKARETKTRGDRGRPRLLVTCHRRENWGRGIGAIAMALRRIASQRIAEVEVILHPNPKVAMQIRQMLLGQEGIAFREPCAHGEALAAMAAADLVLSDSGGIQEEAAALGMPLLVLREKTERPEAIATGNYALVGTDPDGIVSAVEKRLAAPAAKASSVFGDGRAGDRIAQIVEAWLQALDCSDSQQLSANPPNYRNT